ncbi:MAG TPA: FecR domain-containing protein, partial [Candidatus Acidoferrum sp.]|nr:FecR domain-containing protein [Candidatus Acidoferrum sp.]
DGSGRADPELERLERALGQFRSTAGAPGLGLPEGALAAAPPRALLDRWRRPRFLAASVLAVGCALGAVGLFLGTPAKAPLPGWAVAQIEGAPVVGSLTVGEDKGKASLNVGETLVTDSNSRASVEVAEIGELFIDPGSRVRLLETSKNRKRIAVEIGTIHAAIWAPPGEFVVDTPSATAVDLGCAYTLKVASDGSGTLRTQLGWVGFHQNGHDSFIPAGAMCLTRPVEGPGTPYFEDSSEKFRAALHQLDFAGPGSQDRSETLRTVLAQARTKDAFTLWHLLARVDEVERPLVYERLATLVPAPAGTTREGTLSLDRVTLDRWWNSFSLGDIEVWRYWEQNETPAVKKAAS